MNTRRRERGEAAPWLLCILLSLGMLLGPAQSVQAQERTTGTVQVKSPTPAEASAGCLGRLYEPDQRVTKRDRRWGPLPGVLTGNLHDRFRVERFRTTGTPPTWNVQFGRTLRLDASLKVGNMSEAVQVTAETAPLVDTRSTIIAHNVTAEEIDRMPKGRSFQSVAMTAPSVNSGDIEGGFQVNGASGSENPFTVDGVSTNSLLAGQSRQNTVFEYLQEVQVKTVGIPAEFGGALGGVISAVTKSGGNRLPGEGHYYFSGSALSAWPVKRLVLSPVDDRTVQRCRMTSRATTGTRSAAPSAARSSATGCSSSDRSRRGSTRERTIPVLQRHRTRRDHARPDDHERLRQGQLRQPPGQRLLRRAVHADLVTGTLPAYNGTGPQFLSSSKACNDVNLTRGFETAQRNFTGNADINCRTVRRSSA